MRRSDETSGSLFSYVDLEERIPARHPLRKIRQVVNDALVSLDAEFAPVYADFGRPPIAPERLIRASLLHHPASRLRCLAEICRKRVEEPFGWAKTVGPMAQTMRRGRPAILSSPICPRSPSVPQLRFDTHRGVASPTEPHARETQGNTTSRSSL